MKKIDAADLRAFVASCFVAACDVPAADAEIIARAMVEADLVGADAHGTFRLQQYIKAMNAGEVNPRPNITVTMGSKAVALLDGDHGMGHLTMTRAAETVANLAREYGIGWVGLRRSNHAGAIGNYAAGLAAQGFISICTAVAGINQMAPTGSSEALLGSNPIAFAIPAGQQPPFVLDIATSQVAFGKILTAKIENKPLPPGWMIDRETGEALTDVAQIDQALQVALGGYKGLGLSMALGLLAGVLNDASFGRDIPDFADGGSQAPNTGQFIMALDVNAFRPFAIFTADINRHLSDFCNSKRLPSHDTVRLPGMERARRRADRVANGIPMNDNRLGQLKGLAERYNLTRL